VSAEAPELARARAESGAALDALHARILAVLGPRRRALAEAVMAMVEQEAIDRMAEYFVEETRIRSMDFRNGMSMDLVPSRTLVALWVGAARGMLGEAVNYSETEIDYGLADPPGVEMDVRLASRGEHFVFRLQRRGKLTPHQARKLAEERAEAAEAKLAAIAEHCRERRDAAVVQGPVSELCRDIEAIIGGEEGEDHG
jgi:hypothetical protein